MPKFSFVNIVDGVQLEPGSRDGLVPFLSFNIIDSNLGFIGDVVEFDIETGLKTMHVASDQTEADNLGEAFGLRAGNAFGLDQSGGDLIIGPGLGTGVAAAGSLRVRIGIPEVSSSSTLQTYEDLAEFKTGQMTIAGNVGIGTVVAPTRQLEISSVGDAFVKISADRDNLGPDDGTLNAILEFETELVAVSSITARNFFAFHKLTFDLNGSLGAGILNLVGDTGRVGIHVEDPEEDLHVGGGTKINGGLTVVGNVGIGTVVAPTRQLEISSVGDAFLKISADRDNVGPDDGTLNAILEFETELVAVSSITARNFFAFHKLTFDVNGSLGAGILNLVGDTGRVGIHVEDPEEDLHVGGGTKIDGVLEVVGNVTARNTLIVQPSPGGQAFFVMSDVRGGTNEQAGRIVFDGAQALATKGWVFQSVANNLTGFLSNALTLFANGGAHFGGVIDPGANSLQIDGSITVDGLATMSDDLQVDIDLNVDGLSTFVGAALFSGTIQNNVLTASQYVRTDVSKILVSVDKIPASDITAGTFDTGDFVFPGATTVTGIATFNAAIQANTTLTVEGIATFKGDVEIVEDLKVRDKLIVQPSPGSAANFLMSDVRGGTNEQAGRIVFDGAQVLASKGWVFQSVANNLTGFISNGLTLFASGAAHFGGTTHPGAKNVKIDGTLEVDGIVTFNDDLQVVGDLQVDGNSVIGSAITDTVGFYGSAGATQPAGADQAAEVMTVANGAIGGLTIGATYLQAEVQALRDECEKLRDDVENHMDLANALRSALVSLNLIKGAA